MKTPLKNSSAMILVLVGGSVDDGNSGDDDDNATAVNGSSSASVSPSPLLFHRSSKMLSRTDIPESHPVIRKGSVSASICSKQKMWLSPLAFPNIFLTTTQLNYN